MVEICRLTQRRIDPSKKLPKHLEQVKTFCASVGHGIGTVDFVEKVMDIEEDEYMDVVKKSGEYTQFKLGNLTKYFEIEIYREHAQKLEKDMYESKLKDLICSLKEGYIVIRKPI
ncbi:MAG: hypothetical protein HF962_07970 [Sulfurovum sp.]|nr:hypothetical protein [Sulfurovum sp.]